MKEWYCLFKGRKEGPFSVEDLERHPRFCPDTLVWKKGFPQWLKASEVPVFDKIFKEEKRRAQGEKKEQKKESLREVEILTTRLTPPPFYVLLIVLLIFMFFIYYLYNL